MINLDDIGYFLFMQEQEEEEANKDINEEQKENYRGEEAAYNTSAE